MIVFLHGLESGPYGSKYQELSKRWEVSAPDCEGVHDVEERYKVVEAHLEQVGEPCLLVGSSFGGLVATLIATRRPELVKGMVLCAPALHLDAAQQINPELLGQIPTIVLHGTQDLVVPIKYSKLACEGYGVLVEVEDGHRLHESLDEQALRAVSLSHHLLRVLTHPGSYEGHPEGKQPNPIEFDPYQGVSIELTYSPLDEVFVISLFNVTDEMLFGS